jgi:hypothetical protein
MKVFEGTYFMENILNPHIYIESSKNILQSPHQERLDSFIPVVLLTVTARSLPVTLKQTTRNCFRNCGMRALARLVWATGIPSLLRTPANYPQSRQNLCREDGFGDVTYSVHLS